MSAVPPIMSTACRYFRIFSSPPAALALLKMATSKGSLLASKHTSMANPPGFVVAAVTPEPDFAGDCWLVDGVGVETPFDSPSISTTSAAGFSVASSTGADGVGVEGSAITTSCCSCFAPSSFGVNVPEKPIRQQNRGSMKIHVNFPTCQGGRRGRLWIVSCGVVCPIDYICCRWGTRHEVLRGYHHGLRLRNLV